MDERQQIEEEQRLREVAEFKLDDLPPVMKTLEIAYARHVRAFGRAPVVILIGKETRFKLIKELEKLGRLDNKNVWNRESRSYKGIAVRVVLKDDDSVELL